MSVEEPQCVHCGRCCFHMEGDKLVKCRHLVKLRNGKTLCRIYKNRIGAFCDSAKTRECDYRKNSEYNYKDCPLNCLTPNLPMFPEK